MEATEKLRQLVPALFAKRGEAFTLYMANPDPEDDWLWATIIVVYEGRDGEYFKFRIRSHNLFYDPLQFWHERDEVRLLLGEDNFNFDELPYSGRCGENGANHGDKTLTEAMKARAEESQTGLLRRYRIGAGGDCYHYRLFMKHFKLKRAALPLLRKL